MTTYKPEWYEMPSAHKDIVGYNLAKGLFVMPTQLYPNGADNSLLHLTTWDGRNYRPNVSHYFRSEQAVTGWLDRLRKLGAEEAAALTKEIDKLRLVNPAQFVPMSSGPMIGTDPEIFTLRGDGTVLPAFDFLPSEKAASSILLTSSGYRVKAPYWDGFQGEFKIQQCGCLEIFTTQIRSQLEQVLLAAQKVDKKAKLTGRDVMPIPASVLAKADEAHVALGCAPSLNAYDMNGQRPENSRELTTRFAGCHFHISLPKEADRVSVIREMDNLAGIMSVGVLQGLESPVRRQYYGLAGEYRTPSYGVEYRTLSSAVLWHPVLVHLLFGMCRCASQMAQKGFKFWDGSPDETVDIINNLNVDQARTAMKRNRTVLEGLIRWMGRMKGTRDVDQESFLHTDNSALVFDTLLMKGIAQSVELDIESNWRFGQEGAWGQYGRGVKAQVWEFLQDYKPAKVKTAKG